MVIQNNCSYSRYRGITCKDRYDAIDDYFKYKVDGNIICTDNERDIDCDGNIILLTPEGDVVHIGTVPNTEEGAEPATFSMDSDNNLYVKYLIFLDNDHHHSEIEEEIIDCHLTPQRKFEIERHKLMEFLNKNLKAHYNGNYRNELYFSESRKLDKIIVNVKIRKILSRWNMSNDFTKITITRNNDGKYEVKESDEFAKFEKEYLFETFGEGNKPVKDALEKYYQTQK